MKYSKGFRYDDMVTYIVDAISGTSYEDEWEKELKAYLTDLEGDVKEKLSHVEDLDNYD
jgi:hypothetical protein